MLTVAARRRRYQIRMNEALHRAEDLAAYLSELIESDPGVTRNHVSVEASRALDACIDWLLREKVLKLYDRPNRPARD